MATLDALTLWEMDKSKPLTIREGTRTTTCAIRGCPIDAHSWVVTLPNGRTACPRCAADRGWTVR